MNPDFVSFECLLAGLTFACGIVVLYPVAFSFECLLVGLTFEVFFPELMAPHLTLKERDVLTAWAADGLKPVQIRRRLQAQRSRRGLDAPNVTNIRRVFKGATYKQSTKETRGCKRTLTKRQVTVRAE